MSANYAIYTSPTHQPIPDHLPTLIITPHGKPHQILYTYLHTNYNQENYLLTPSDQGDLCVAKLFPPPKHPKASHNNNQPPQSSSSSSGHSHKPQQAGPTNADRTAIRCEASRNLKWTIRNEGIQHPVFKLTLPNPDNPHVEQPLFQVSKPNPNCPWWSLFYFTYAGHLIPPKRVEFGKIMKTPPVDGRRGTGETKITVTGKTDEEKAVWKTLGEGNEDMVEWILVCAALNVLDEEIGRAAEAAGVQMAAQAARPAPSRAQVGSGPTGDRPLHPTGNAQRPPVTAPIRPAVYSNPSRGGPTAPLVSGQPRPPRLIPGRSAPASPQPAANYPHPRPPQFHPSPGQRGLPPPSTAGRSFGGERPGPVGKAGGMGTRDGRSSNEAAHQPSEQASRRGQMTKLEMFDDAELPYARPAQTHSSPRGSRVYGSQPPGSSRAMASPHHHSSAPNPSSTPLRPPQHYVGPSVSQLNHNGQPTPPTRGSNRPPVNYPAVVPRLKPVR